LARRQKEQTMERKIVIARLAFPGLLIEIDATAVA
jgi:hypothetical protein